MKKKSKNQRRNSPTIYLQFYTLFETISKMKAKLHKAHTLQNKEKIF